MVASTTVVYALHGITPKFWKQTDNTFKVETQLARVQLASRFSHWNTWKTSHFHIASRLASLLRTSSSLASKSLAGKSLARLARRDLQGESASTFPLHHERDGSEIVSAVDKITSILDSLLRPRRQTNQSLIAMILFCSIPKRTAIIALRAIRERNGPRMRSDFCARRDLQASVVF